MSETVWGMIAEMLIKNGFDVYSPSTHVGECQDKYIVVKDDGAAKIAGISSYDYYYDVLLYIPEGKYSQMEQFINDVVNVLSGLKPTLIPTHKITPSFYDSDKKAYMVSIQYKNHRKC